MWTTKYTGLKNLHELITIGECSNSDLSYVFSLKILPTSVYEYSTTFFQNEIIMVFNMARYEILSGSM